MISGQLASATMLFAKFHAATRKSLSDYQTFRHLCSIVLIFNFNLHSADFEFDSNTKQISGNN